MNLANLSQKDLTARCAWCHKVMPDDKECFWCRRSCMACCKAHHCRLEGKLVPMRLSTGREIIVIVPTADSEARAQGHDIYIQACSEECCTAASEAIQAELPGSN